MARSKTKKMRVPPPNHPTRKTNYDPLNTLHCYAHPYTQTPCGGAVGNCKLPTMNEKQRLEYINEIKGANSEEVARMQREMIEREQKATEQRWIRLCLGVTAFCLWLW